MVFSYGPPGCRLRAPELLVRAPWLLVRGRGTPLLSFILLLITVICVISEKKTATKHR